jgi:hypothetical protein
LASFAWETSAPALKLAVGNANEVMNNTRQAAKWFFNTGTGCNWNDGSSGTTSQAAPGEVTN